MVQNRLDQCFGADIFFDTVRLCRRSHGSHRICLMALPGTILLTAHRCPTGAFVSRLTFERGCILCRFHTTRHAKEIMYSFLRAHRFILFVFQVDFTTAVDDAVYRRPCMYGEGPVPLAFRSDGQVSLLSSYAKTTCSVGESTEVMKVRIFVLSV